MTNVKAAEPAMTAAVAAADLDRQITALLHKALRLSAPRDIAESVAVSADRIAAAVDVLAKYVEQLPAAATPNGARL